MEEEIKTIFSKAAAGKNRLTIQEWRVLAAIVGDGGAVEPDTLGMLTGKTDMPRLIAAANSLTKRGFLRRERYGAIKTITEQNSVRNLPVYKYILNTSNNNINNTYFSNSPITHRKNSTTHSELPITHTEIETTPTTEQEPNIIKPKVNPVRDLYGYMEQKMGRPSRNMGADMLAMKRMYLQAYKHVEGEEWRGFQAMGLVRDYMDYKIDEWVIANANQPGLLLSKNFEAYLSVVPSKPKEYRRDEVQTYHSRMRYNLKTKDWDRTRDYLPNYTPKQ